MSLKSLPQDVEVMDAGSLIRSSRAPPLLAPLDGGSGWDEYLSGGDRSLSALKNQQQPVAGIRSEEHDESLSPPHPKNRSEEEEDLEAIVEARGPGPSEVILRRMKAIAELISRNALGFERVLRHRESNNPSLAWLQTDHPWYPTFQEVLEECMVRASPPPLPPSSTIHQKTPVVAKSPSRARKDLTWASEPPFLMPSSPRGKQLEIEARIEIMGWEKPQVPLCAMGALSELLQEFYKGVPVCLPIENNFPSKAVILCGGRSFGPASGPTPVAAQDEAWMELLRATFSTDLRMLSILERKVKKEEVKFGPFPHIDDDDEDVIASSKDLSEEVLDDVFNELQGQVKELKRQLRQRCTWLETADDDDTGGAKSKKRKGA